MKWIGHSRATNMTKTYARPQLIQTGHRTQIARGNAGMDKRTSICSKFLNKTAEK